MRFFQNKRGFTLIELMIAGLVVTVGLTGVAAMQITALKGTFSANSNSNGSGIALAWAEWLNGLMSHTDQEKFQDNVTNMWNRENLITLMNLDTLKTDTMAAYDPDKNIITPFVEYMLPSSTEDIAKCFNGQKPFVSTSGGSKTLTFIKQGHTLFTAADMPPPAPVGSHLLLRVAANVPFVNVATVEVSIPYSNAFTNKRGATLHFVVSSNM